ncbi:S8 family serine peptidase [Brevibacterium sp. p3-SID960]|uniref:S8 family peptidase n=1 Tax=Brevibacterium sp. p3-SID960 TaxID=2916063 RepID=UPI0021A4FBFB|nr:S8 family serine peptidase [Brevibacterium sp. p3-SID960]MCT1690972.1 S8 family serine peptidase [Brevibacterium sp. p3-SID960]
MTVADRDATGLPRARRVRAAWAGRAAGQKLAAAAAALALATGAGLAEATLASGPAQAAEPEAGPGQWFIADYGIDEMWKTTTGKGTTVAVIDSGVDAAHENLTDTVVKAKDFSETGADGTTPLGDGSIIHHGTAIAGVIAGNGSGPGPMGVAPDADLLSASMWLGSNRPESSPPSRQQAAAALRWAVDEGADVVNMSLGWDDPTWDPDWDEAFAYAFEHDVVVIACVGNRSQGARKAWAPSTVPGVVGVGGLGTNGQVRAESTAPGIAVDLMGPAEDIPVPLPGGEYGTGDGCSFAAPVVAGVAALIRSNDPDLSADEVVAKLYTTATPVPGHDGTTTPEQPDPVVGHGRLAPLAALNAEVPADVPQARQQLADWVTMHRRAPATSEQAEPGADSGKETSREGQAQITPATASAAGPAMLIIGGLAGSGLIAAGIARMRRTPRSEADPPAPPE